MMFNPMLNNMGMGMNNMGMGMNNMGVGMNNMGMGMNNMGMGMNNMGIGVSKSMNLKNNNMNVNNLNNNLLKENNNNNSSSQINMLMTPSFNNINHFGNKTEGGVPKELIPRGNVFKKADYYKGLKYSDKINIVIQASSGMSVSLPSPPNISIAQLIQNYLKKINLPQDVLNKDITFIFEANVLNPFDLNPIFTKFKDNSLILVIDTQNIISA